MSGVQIPPPRPKNTTSWPPLGGHSFLLPFLLPNRTQLLCGRHSEQRRIWVCGGGVSLSSVLGESEVRMIHPKPASAVAPARSCAVRGAGRAGESGSAKHRQTGPTEPITHRNATPRSAAGWSHTVARPGGTPRWSGASGLSLVRSSTHKPESRSTDTLRSPVSSG